MPESETIISARSSAIDITSDLKLLREAAAGAASIAMRHFRNAPAVRLKSGNSPVSAADLEADDYLRDVLMAARPHYGWLSEESHDLARDWAGKAAIFVVDPIDGTRAFINGEETWCVSLAVVSEARALAGVLHCPATGEIFEAHAGGGAFRSGKPVHATVKAGGGLHLAGPKPLVEAASRHLPGNTRRHETIPSLAYRIAMVADGRLDGTYVRPNACDWDIAAAAVILSEAGGAIVMADGTVPPLGGPKVTHGHLVAAARHAVSPMLAALNKVI